MRDLSPEEMEVFRGVEAICRRCFTGWGYREVRTPTIEYLHLFTSAGTLTPGRLGKVYSFLDWDGWSGERVVLRPDGTIPVARLYAESLKNQGLARLFYAANIFIFEESPEHPRERWQCGVELIGAGSAVADAELVALSLEVLKKLGLKNIEVRLSHAGLVRALLEKLGLSPEEQHRTFDRILDGDAGLLAEITKDSPGLGKAIRPLLGTKGRSPGFLRDQRAGLAREMPDLAPCLDDFLATVAVLDELGGVCKIDIASGAGFEYYTGLIFQLYSGGERVGGGGRYDALIPAMGGGDVPAAGFALYVDSLMKLVSPGAVTPVDGERVLLRIKSGVIKDAFGLADRLRRQGYTVALDLSGKSRGADWTVEVRDKTPLFVITDKSGSRRDAPDVAGVLKILEGKGDR
jgi:histidyl-tRNA synthetase